MRDDEVAVVDGAQRDQGTSPFDGCAAIAQRDLCLAEQLDHRSGIEPVRAGRGEPPAQDSRRHRRLAPPQMQRADRRSGFLTPLDAAQHPGRVLDPSLREPELGERPGGERVRRLEDTLRHRDRIGEKCLGGAPVTVFEQDPAVVGAALRIQERAPVPVDEALERLHPLRRPLQIETTAAHHHGHAAHLRDRQRITALAADHAGHRLIQERHAFVGPALLHQGLPDGMHRHQLQIGVAVRPPDLGRLPR